MFDCAVDLHTYISYVSCNKEVKGVKRLIIYELVYRLNTYCKYYSAIPLACSIMYALNVV